MNRVQRNEYLNDYGNAVELRLQKTERAKELIAQILMVTTGVSEIPDNREWAQGNLLELFEIFMINHDNFSRSNLAEDLQTFLFTYTRTHDNCYQEWREKVFATRGLDDGGEALEETDKPLDLSNSSVEDLSQKLSEIMHNPNLPARLHDCLGDGLANLAGGQIGELINSPEMIAKALKEGDNA